MIKEQTMTDLPRTSLTHSEDSELDREQIVKWMLAHKARHGTLPSRMSGIVEDAKGETWREIEDALVWGRRGLPGGQHLGTLKTDLVPKPVSLPSPRLGIVVDKITREEIAEWMKTYAARHGHYPTSSSGQVEGTANMSWFRVHTALLLGQRGLPGSQTLEDLKQDFLDTGVLPAL